MTSRSHIPFCLAEWFAHEKREVGQSTMTVLEGGKFVGEGASLGWLFNVR